MTNESYEIYRKFRKYRQQRTRLTLPNCDWSEIQSALFWWHTLGSCSCLPFWPHGSRIEIEIAEQWSTWYLVATWGDGGWLVDSIRVRRYRIWISWEARGALHIEVDSLRSQPTFFKNKSICPHDFWVKTPPRPTQRRPRTKQQLIEIEASNRWPHLSSDAMIQLAPQYVVYINSRPSA